MDKVIIFLRAITEKATALLQGEPALVIGNGAAVVIYLVAKAFGAIPDVDFPTAVAEAVAAIAVINTVLLYIRKFVTPVASLTDDSKTIG